VVVGTVTSYKELQTFGLPVFTFGTDNHQAHSSVSFSEAYGGIIVIVIIIIINSNSSIMFEGLKNNTISKLALSRFLSQSL
jgi:hypothetical protein